MQKKILVSLLMTAPVGLTAFADINLPDLNDPHNWFPNGLAGEGYQIGDNSLDCQIGNGEVSQIIKDLPKGRYQIFFDTQKNLTVEVYQNGKKLDVDKNATLLRYEFETEADLGDVTVKLIPESKPDPFSYTGCRLVLAYDFPAEAQRLYALRNALLPGGVSEDSPLVLKPSEGVSVEAKAELQTRFAELRREYLDQINKIKAMNEEGASDDALMALYKGEMLFNDVAPYGESDMNSEIAKALKALKTKVEAYNAAVQAQDLLANITVPGGLDEKLAALTTAIKTERSKVGYVDLSKCLDETADISEAIKDYEKRVEEAYANNDLADQIEGFKAEYEALDKRIDDLQAQFDADKADNEAFKAYTALKKSLEDEYNKIFTDISGFKGVDGNSEVYMNNPEAVPAWLDAVQKLYFAAAAKDYGFKDSVTPEDSENIEAATEGIKADIAALKAAFTGYETIVNNQNEWMQFILDDISSISEAFAEAKEGITVPDAFKAEYDNKVKAIEDAIAALKSGSEEKYAVQGLEKPEADTAIRAMIDDLKVFVKPFATLNELMGNLDDAIAKVAEMGNIAGTAIPYAEKFGTSKGNANGTYGYIDAAIKALTPDSEGNLNESEVENIKSQIAEILVSAEKLKSTFDGIEKIFTDYQAALDGLADYAAGKEENGFKIVLPEEEREALRSSLINGTAYKGLTDDLGNFKAKRDSIAAEAGQDCYDDGNAFYEELGQDTWETEIADLRNSFSENVTKKTNFANTETMLKDAGTAAGITGTGSFTLDYLGIEDMKAEIDGLRTKLANIKSEMDTASDSDGYDAVDLKLKDLQAEIVAFNEKVTALQASQDAYDELNALLPNLGSNLDNLKEYNDKNSIDNGKDHFAAIIGEPTDAAGTETLYAQLAAIKADLEKAYNDKTAADNKAAIKTRIDNLETIIKNTKTDVEYNNSFHDSQIEEWNNISAKLTGAIATLEGKNSELVSEWKTALESLRTNGDDEAPDLMQVSEEIYEAYGEGASNSKNGDITGDLTYISNEIDRILNEIKAEYPDKVGDVNDQTVADCNWTATLKELSDTYKASIETFNDFYYDLNNVGYREVLKPEMKRHEGIYEYSQIIKDLPGQLTEWLKEQKDAEHIITKDEFNEKWTALVETYISEMHEKVTAMNETANAVAGSYYGQLHASAEQVIADAQNKLDEAGITGEIATKCLNSVKNGLENAELLYGEATVAEEGWSQAQEWEAKAAFQKQLPGLAMDRIADILDQVLNPANIDLQKAAKDAWNEAYPSQEQLDELRKVFLGEEEGGTCPDADPELKAEQLEIFDQAVKDIKALGSDVDAISKGLIDVYAEKKAELDRLMEIINGSVDAVKASQAKAEAEKQAYTDLQTEIAGLTTSYNELLDYLKGFSQAYRIDTGAMEASIAAFRKYVELHRGSLTVTEIKGVTDQTLASIEGSLAYAKQRVSSLELDYVSNTLANRVKVAFNDAKVKTTDKEAELNEINDQIDGILEAVDAIDNSFGEEGFDFDAYKEAILEHEAELCGILQTLDSMWEGDRHESDPAKATTDRLDARYGEVAQGIADGQAVLDGCYEEVKALYEADYAELKSELDAIKEGWLDDGNSIIVQEANYMAAMDKVEAGLNALNEKVAAAEEKAREEAAIKAANEQAYTDLKAEYDGLEAEFNNVKELIAGYGESEAYWNTEITDIEALLEASLADLDARHEAIKLNDESTLLNAETIAAKTADLKVKSTRTYTNRQLDIASTALQAAAKSLQASNIVPEAAKDLKAQLDALNDSYSQIKYDSYTAGYDRLAEIIEEAQRIVSEAKAIEENVAANTFFPGDVNLNPDGTVSVADVVMLINWVGEGITYEELYSESPRQACAADLNGDHVLDISDVTMDINLALGMTPTEVRAGRLQDRVAGDNTFALQLVSEENGVKRYALVVSNSAAFVGGQLDLKVSGSAAITAVGAAARTQSHDLALFDGSFGSKRLVITSMANAEIEGSEGAMIYIDVEGNGKLDVENALFADINANAYEIKKADTRLVDSIIDGARDVKEKIYNVAGQALDKLQRGINIVRKGNGKASKEMHK